VKALVARGRDAAFDGDDGERAQRAERSEHDHREHERVSSLAKSRRPG
jgi:hypothetical protein